MKTPTSTMRVTETVRDEVARMSKLCGEQPAELLERAWKEYLLNHRAQFAADLEQAAVLVRDGSTDALVTFVQDAHHQLVVDDEVFEAPAVEDKSARLLADAAAALAETREAGLLIER